MQSESWLATKTLPDSKNSASVFSVEVQSRTADIKEGAMGAGMVRMKNLSTKTETNMSWLP